MEMYSQCLRGRGHTAGKGAAPDLVTVFQRHDARSGVIYPESARDALAVGCFQGIAGYFRDWSKGVLSVFVKVLKIFPGFARDTSGTYTTVVVVACDVRQIRAPDTTDYHWASPYLIFPG